MSFADQILNIATSRNWALMGINLLLSTIIGGIVIIILLSIFGKIWKESLKVQNAFLMVLLINIINIFGILVVFSPSIPAAGLLLPLLVWIGFTKLFFHQMKWWHAAVAGMVGYALSIFIIPSIVASFIGIVPSFPSFN